MKSPALWICSLTVFLPFSNIFAQRAILFVLAQQYYGIEYQDTEIYGLMQDSNLRDG